MKIQRNFKHYILALYHGQRIYSIVTHVSAGGIPTFSKLGWQDRLLNWNAKHHLFKHRLHKWVEWTLVDEHPEFAQGRCAKCWKPIVMGVDQKKPKYNTVRYIRQLQAAQEKGVDTE